jgi:hypothetical protein
MSSSAHDRGWCLRSRAALQQNGPSQDHFHVRVPLVQTRSKRRGARRLLLVTALTDQYGGPAIAEKARAAERASKQAQGRGGPARLPKPSTAAPRHDHRSQPPSPARARELSRHAISQQVSEPRPRPSPSSSAEFKSGTVLLPAADLGPGDDASAE